MNILNTLRKPYFAIFLSSLVLFVSCSQYDDGNKPINLDANTLKNMHQDVKTGMVEGKNDFESKKAKSAQKSEAEALFIENAGYLSKHTLEELFIKNNIDTEIISELEFFENNRENENVYQELIDNFNIDSQEEATILVTIIEVKKLVEQKLGSSSKYNLSKSEIKRISWECGLAIAGTVGATIGFIGVTGGWGLVYALSMKGLATAALIEAC